MSCVASSGETVCQSTFLCRCCDSQSLSALAPDVEQVNGSSTAAADGSQQKDEGEVKGGQHEQEESSRAQSCVKAKGLSACKSISYIPAHFIRCSVAFKKQIIWWSGSCCTLMGTYYASMKWSPWDKSFSLL